MNGLTDSLTIGIMITLVFGAVCFYLYSRLVQNEKRVALVENILLDLRVSMEQSGGLMDSHQDEGPVEVNHIEPISGPMPLEKEDIEQTDEDFYKNILDQTSTQAGTPLEQTELKAPPSSPVATSSKVQANYESMTVKELKALAKQKGLSVPSGAGRKELMDTLRKNDKSDKAEVEGGSSLGKVEGYSLDAEVLEG